MLKKALLLGIVLVGLLIPTVVSADATANVDTVILASTENYPDALVAGSAAAKIGAPVLLTEKGELTEDTRAMLNRLAPSEIIIVGGEAVISEEVQQTLKDAGYNGTRLWGNTRYGTSVEVAEHFWVEGAEEAVLVQNNLEDGDGHVLAAAKELARDEEKPVFLTPENKVPAVVLSSLENLGVTSITAVGTSVSSEYRASLEEAGITITEEITGSDETQVRERIQAKIAAKLNASKTMIVVASDSFRASIATSNFPGHHVFHVSDDEGVQEAVTAANKHGVKRIKVVGEPDFAEEAATTLRTETEADVHLVVGGDEDSARLNANLTAEERPSFAKQHERQMKKWEEKRQEHHERIQKRVNKTIQKADELVDENTSREAQEKLRKARLLYSNGDYFEAMEEAREAISTVREERFESVAEDRAEAIRESMAEEMESLDERTEDLRKLNHEFADEMKENLTVEERLKIIEEFRHERRETIEKMVEETSERDTDLREELSKRLQDSRQRIRDRSSQERFEFEAECTDETTNGTAVVRSRIAGHDGKISAKGRLLMPTPNYDASASSEKSGQTIDITVDVKQRDGFGIECVGETRYEYRVGATAGNWTVNLVLNEDGHHVHRETQTVTVTPDEHEDRMRVEPNPDPRKAACERAVEEAKDAAEGKICTEQIQKLACPFEDSFTYTARNGCEISYLKDQGWTAGEHESGGEEEPVNDSETHVVTYSSDGFSPRKLEIEQGDTVTWRTEGPTFWLASNDHPTHTEYHGTSRSEHCGSEDLAGERLDACESGERYEFTFEKTGTWEYHDHDASWNQGVIVVR